MELKTFKNGVLIEVLNPRVKRALHRLYRLKCSRAKILATLGQAAEILQIKESLLQVAATAFLDSLEKRDTLPTLNR